MGRQFGLILKEEHSHFYKVNFIINSAAYLTNQAFLGPFPLMQGEHSTEWTGFLSSIAFWKVYSEHWCSLWGTESYCVLKDWILNFRKCWAAVRTYVARSAGSPGCSILYLRNAMIQAKNSLKLFWVLKSYVKKKTTTIWNSKYTFLLCTK